MTTALSAFVPTFQFISNITQANNAVVTFTQDHGYVLGEILSFRVSKPYGMVQINNLSGTIQSLTTNTVTMDINTLQFTPFITPDGFQIYPAMAVPAGSGIIPDSIPRTVTLLDSFDNVPES